MLSWEGFEPVQMRLESRVTSSPGLPETILVLALKALILGIPSVSSKQGRQATPLETDTFETL